MPLSYKEKPWPYNKRGGLPRPYEGATFLYKTGDATAVQDASNRGQNNITRCTIVHTKCVGVCVCVWGGGGGGHGVTRGADT